MTASLDELGRSEEQSIPNAVLNRTRCVVVVAANGDRGIASCVESLNQWTRPAYVTFAGKRSPKADLMLFVLGEKEAKALREGRLEVSRPSSSAGPTITSKPVLTDADLNYGSLWYEYAVGKLDGGAVEGTVSPVATATTIVTKSDAEVRLQRSLASFFNVITPMGIIIHHTAVLPTSNKVPNDKREVDAYHEEKGFDVICLGHEYHVAYHYLVLPNGEVQAGRPERCQGAHASGYNAYLGISVAGDFSSKDNPAGQRGPTVPSAKQTAALVTLCRRLREKYKFPLHRIMRHSDVSPTECPGDRFPFVQVLTAVGR